MKHFHAHVYFENKNLSDAIALARVIQLSDVFDEVKVLEKPIGPHPLGMIEVHFCDQSYDVAVQWFKLHRSHFSVLIHQDSGDDVKDHTDGILWLGPQLKLDFSFFEFIKNHPEFKIHS